MLLWTVLRYRVRDLPQIEEFRPKIEKFHLAAAGAGRSSTRKVGRRTRVEGFQNRSRTSSLNRVLNARTLIRLKKGGYYPFWGCS